MTPEIMLTIPVLFLITIVIVVLLFNEGPWSNITSAVRVRVDDTKRRGLRNIQREDEEASKAREQDRNFIILALLTIFAILFTYVMNY
jgi:hypothetical protein